MEQPFLKNLKIEQFIKSNSDTVKSAMGSLGGDLSGGLKSIVANQQKMLVVSNKLLLSNTKMSDSLSKIFKQQERSLLSITKQQSQNYSSTVKQLAKDMIKKKVGGVVEKVRDAYKREDPNEENSETFKSMNKYLKMMSMVKEKAGNGLLSLLGGIGKAFMGAGLLGYLMTGRSELLNNVAKGFRYSMISVFKTIPNVIKGVLGFGTKAKDGIESTFKNIGSIVNGAKKLATAFTSGGVTGALSTAKNMFKSKMVDMVTPIKNATSGIVKTFTAVKGVVSTFSKVGIGAGLKAAGAGAKNALKAGITAGKVGLKKLPVVGALFGVIFGIQRFRKGDTKGGLLELASGLSSMIPGVGIPLGIAIDAYLLARDLKGWDKPKANKPVLGGSIGSGSKPKGNLLSFLGITQPSPTFDSPNGNIGGTGFDLSDDAILRGNGYTREQIQEAKVKKKKSTYSSKKEKIDRSFSKGSLGKFTKSIKDLVKRDKINSIKLNNAKGMQPDMTGLKPEFRSRFEKMAEEFHKSTGGYIGVNSAKRNGSGSVHNVGYAIDANVYDAKGGRYGDGYIPDSLLEKYGMHKPLLRWKSNYGGSLDEPWHVEPFPGEDKYGGKRNTLVPQQKYRNGLIAGNSAYDSGGDNLPKGSLGSKKVVVEDKALSLSADTIQALAVAFGKQVSENIPTHKTEVSRVNVGNPRNL